jgi:hypothetical protein
MPPAHRFCLVAPCHKVALGEREQGESECAEVFLQKGSLNVYRQGHVLNYIGAKSRQSQLTFNCVANGVSRVVFLPLELPTDGSLIK